VRFEMAGIDPIHHLTEPLVDENDIPFEPMNKDKEDCGNCLDLPFFSFRFINDKSLNSNALKRFITTALPPQHWIATTYSPQLGKNLCAPPFFISSFNTTMQNIALLI